MVDIISCQAPLFFKKGTVCQKLLTACSGDKVKTPEASVPHDRISGHTHTHAKKYKIRLKLSRCTVIHIDSSHLPNSPAEGSIDPCGIKEAAGGSSPSKS